MLFAVIQTRIGSDAQKIMGRNPGFEAFWDQKTPQTRIRKRLRLDLFCERLHGGDSDRNPESAEINTNLSQFRKWEIDKLRIISSHLELQHV